MTNPIAVTDSAGVRTGSVATIDVLANDTKDVGTTWAAVDPVTIVSGPNKLAYTTDLFAGSQQAIRYYAPTAPATISNIALTNPFGGAYSTDFYTDTGQGQVTVNPASQPTTLKWKVDSYSILSCYVKKPTADVPQLLSLSFVDLSGTQEWSNEIRFSWAGDAPLDSGWGASPKLVSRVESVGDGWYRISVAAEGLGKDPTDTLDGDTISTYIILKANWPPESSQVKRVYISSPQFEQRLITSGDNLPSPYQPIPTLVPTPIPATVVADASTGLVTFTSDLGAPIGSEVFYYTATDSNGLTSDPTRVTVDVLESISESAGDAELAAADGTTGVFAVPIHQPVDDLEITITDTTPGRIALENIEWELQHRSRASTWAGR